MLDGKLATRVCFDGFEVDLRSGELYRSGQKIALPDQSFRVLELLIGRPGQLVTREEIRERLWPNGTIVEFENAINAAIKKLRSALGEAADQPRYIETIKRRGYRLIVPVEDVSSSPVSRDDSVPDCPAELSGKRVSHYRVLDLIGSGGMGVVYRAEDSRLGRHVALKFLPKELSNHPIALERLRLEARSASSLNHPNICTIYEIGEEAGQPFIVMELLEGCSLRDRISGRPLAMNEVLDYGSQIAQGLEAAHSKGIVHRDVKPANIFITNDGVSKILDFGLAKATPLKKDKARHLTRPGEAAGTVAYMSPEQASAEELDERSDLFSFGVVLHEMATGRLPPPGLALSGLRPGLKRIISKCLETDRDLRYETASEIRADLQRLKPGRIFKSETARHWKAATILAATLIAISTATHLYFRSPPRLTEKDTIVLADFTNKTGDPVFDGTLRQGLAIQLEQSPFLSLISERRIEQTLQLMGRSAGAPLTPEVAREVCERTGSAAVLEGSIASLGTRYVLGLRAEHCSSGKVIDEDQAQAARKEDVLNALTQIARRFRSRVGESLATVREHDTPLAEATTPSLEALKAYTAARKVLFSAGTVAAVPLFQRAVQIDPQFALAHSALGLTYAALGASDLAVESTAKAYRFRDRASEREKFFISANYERVVTRNLEKAQQACEVWAQRYPRDPDAHAIFAGFPSQGAGNYEKSIEEANKAIELDPDHAFAYVNLAASYLFLNRLQDAENTIRKASERKLVIPELLITRYYIAFFQHDQAEMDREAARAEGKSGAEDWMSHSEALVLARSGKLDLARRMSRRAVDVALQTGQKERAATYETGAATWEAFFGNARNAKQHAMAALNISKSRDVGYGAAFVLARMGDSVQPLAIANDLQRRFPDDTSVRFTYLPVLRAILALNHHAPAQAIELLQAAAPYELAMHGLAFFGLFGGLYPAYLRGEAYLALRQGAQAAAEFQKVLDHPGIVVADPTGALAHLQLGRAFVLAKDNARARAAYEEFLALWKDADSNIPILKQAQAEYARLR